MAELRATVEGLVAAIMLLSSQEDEFCWGHCEQGQRHDAECELVQAALTAAAALLAGTGEAVPTGMKYEDSRLVDTQRYVYPEGHTGKLPHADVPNLLHRDIAPTPPGVSQPVWTQAEIDAGKREADEIVRVTGWGVSQPSAALTDAQLSWLGNAAKLASIRDASDDMDDHWRAVAAAVVAEFIKGPL